MFQCDFLELADSTNGFMNNRKVSHLWVTRMRHSRKEHFGRKRNNAWIDRMVVENSFWKTKFPRRRNGKTGDSFSFVIHFPLPPLIKLSSHLVRSSRIQFQIKPRFHQGFPFPLLFIVSSLSRFQPFRLLSSSSFRPPLFRQAFSRIQPAGDKELESSGRRAICHSVA